MFHSLSWLILDKADNVEPNYTDGSTCIQEAENETCEVQWERVVTYIGMAERYNALFVQNNYVMKNRALILIY
jgi:hypothetical protein